VAIDLSQGSEELGELLRNQVQKMLGSRPGARLACLNVLRGGGGAEEGANPHVQRLLELRHWAAPLRLAEGRVTFHVLEAPDPAAAILDYARANRVDHLVLGARENSLSGRLLGSVSGQVAAEAPCSVTVVRRRRVE
jgi:nucleotide-binding universal stress UspA family protein